MRSSNVSKAIIGGRRRVVPRIGLRMLHDMKVLMLSDYFPPHVGGGVEKVVYEISKRLALKGVEVVVLTLNTDRAMDFEALDGIRVYRCMAVNLTGAIGAQLSVSPSAPFGILDVCRKERPDIVHANNRFFTTTMFAVALKRLLHRPLVTTLHLGPMAFESRPLSVAVRSYELTIGRSIVRLSDKIIAVSRAVKAQAVWLGAEPDDVAVVPNGVDLREFRPKGVRGSSGAKRIACVGRLIPNKGVQFLIGASPAVLSAHPDAEFVIVGDGPMKDDLVEMAERMGVKSAFRFLGTVPSVSDVLSGCRIFVRPSLTEGMPLTVLEAMACGLPVVASRISGTPEVVLDGETGILVEAGNVRQIAEAITKLLSDGRGATRMGENALRLVRERYSWDRAADLVMRVYEEVLKKTDRCD